VVPGIHRPIDANHRCGHALTVDLQREPRLVRRRDVDAQSGHSRIYPVELGVCRFHGFADGRRRIDGQLDANQTSVSLGCLDQLPELRLRARDEQ
jgi:hypothetical protein